MCLKVSSAKWRPFCLNVVMNCCRHSLQLSRKYVSCQHTLLRWVEICKRSWWRHQKETFPRYWPSVRGIHRSPVNSPHKGQWRGALMFSLICVWINGWVNNRESGDLRRYLAHYDVTVMLYDIFNTIKFIVVHLCGIFVPKAEHWSTSRCIQHQNYSYWNVQMQIWYKSYLCCRFLF